MFRQLFDLSGQLPEPGSQSWTKEVFEHRKADTRIKNFYANESLLRVSTLINMFVILAEQLKYDYFLV